MWGIDSWLGANNGGGGGEASTSFTLQTDDTLVAGNLVYTKAINTLALARADVVGTTDATGMTTVAAAATTAADIRSQGIVELPDWSAVQVGGASTLSAGQSYFLSNAEAGKITLIAPTSGYVVKVGRASSTTRFDLDIEQRIQL